MRIFKVKSFARFQRAERLEDTALCRAARDAGSGLIDVDLGGGLIKQRVARSGQGKSGGYRTIIAFKRRDRAVFLYGFAKNAKANLKPDESAALIRIGARWLAATDTEIDQALATNELMEVSDGTAE